MTIPRSTDARTRDAARRGDAATLLRERLRAGLNPLLVELAAFCGDPAALEVCDWIPTLPVVIPRPNGVDLPTFLRRVTYWGHEPAAHAALAALRCVAALDAAPAVTREDFAPRLALAADTLQEWIDGGYRATEQELDEWGARFHGLYWVDQLVERVRWLCLRDCAGPGLTAAGMQLGAGAEACRLVEEAEACRLVEECENALPTQAGRLDLYAAVREAVAKRALR